MGDKKVDKTGRINIVFAILILLLAVTNVISAQKLMDNRELVRDSINMTLNAYGKTLDCYYAHEKCVERLMKNNTAEIEPYLLKPFQRKNDTIDYKGLWFFMNTCNAWRMKGAFMNGCQIGFEDDGGVTLRIDLVGGKAE